MVLKIMAALAVAVVVVAVVVQVATALDTGAPEAAATFHESRALAAELAGNS